MPRAERATGKQGGEHGHLSILKGAVSQECGAFLTSFSEREEP